MANPYELIQKARENKRRAAAPPVRREPVRPVPPAPMPPPVSHHGAYSELMRSHDRMHTRHLG